jgi:antirestriction protein ArdC
MEMQGGVTMSKARVQDTYDAQAEALLESIKAGVAPWAKPWQTLGAQRNARTGRLYRGVNALYLSVASSSGAYELPLWLTWRQARDLGGHVKDAQWDKGYGVIWFRPDERVKTDGDGNVVLDENGDPELVRFWRSGAQVVYNVAQTTVDPAKYAKYVPEELPELERNARIERFIEAVSKGSSFDLKYGGDVACYRPLSDEVVIPPARLYRAIAEFYSTHFHEFGHATGHKSRLARGVGGLAIVGEEAYAEEELVAELTAAFVGAELQLDGRCQHAEYLGHWFKRLEDDTRYFYKAASKAKKAVAWLQKAAERGGYVADEEPQQEAA